MKKISAKQQQILDYISSYSLEHGYPPSVREIGAEMGLRSPSTVHAHLKKLQEAGYLEPNEHKSRALTPVSGPSMVPRVPILGRVTAGMPILAVEEHIGYVPFEPAAGGGEYYALRIRGDSMIGVGIMDDDLVIIRQDIQARNGDIVIALLEDEATCKTLNITPDGVWLMPENPAYPPINGTGARFWAWSRRFTASIESSLFRHRLSGGRELPQACSPLTAGGFSLVSSGGFRRLWTAGTSPRPAAWARG